MRIIDLALKDLKQMLQDRKSLLFLVLMPVIFTYFMGFAFNSAGAPADPRLPVGWVDADGGPLSAHLLALLEASDAVRVEPLDVHDPAALDELVRKGDYAAVVSIPAGYSRQTLAGEQPRLGLTADQADGGGQAARQVVQAALVHLLGAVETGRLSLQAQEAARPFATGAERQAALEAAVGQAILAWQDASLEVVVEQAAAEPREPNFLDNGFAQSSPGILVQFAVFGLTFSASTLTLERKTRTLQRMLTTSISRAEIIAGHMLAMFLLVFLQGAILVVVGQFALGVDYLRQPLAVLLVMTALGLWIAGLGMLLGTLAKDEEQANLGALLCMFLFSALAGAWFPLDVAGKAFYTVGHLTPGAWAMDGFQNIVMRGLGLESVLLPVGVLLAYAAGFFALAVWRFRYE